MMDNTPQENTPIQPNTRQRNGERMKIESISELKIMALNTNSLVTNCRRAELTSTLKRHSPHVMLLSETKLNHKHQLSFKGYKMTRVDRPNAKRGGGTAILIRENIPHEEITHPSSRGNTILEFAGIKVPTTTQNSLLIISVYATNSSKVKFIEELDNMCKELRLDDPNVFFIIAGDLNARHSSWGDTAHNQRGRYMANWKNTAIKFKINFLHPAEPTFPRSGSYLDMGLVDARLTIVDSRNGKSRVVRAESDHKALSFTVCLRNLGENAIETRAPKHRFLYKKTNWEKFKEKAEAHYHRNIPHNRNLSIEEIDEWLRDTDTYIKETMEKNIPKNKSRNSTDKYINSKITGLKRDRSYLITQLNRRRHEYSTEQRESIKETIRLINYKIAQEFAISTNRFWAQKARGINHRKPVKFFPIVNAMFRKKEGIQIRNLTVTNQQTALLERSGALEDATCEKDGSYQISDPKKKLDVLGAHFEAVNAPSFLNEGSRLKDIVDRRTEEFRADEARNSRVTDFSDRNPAHSPQAPEDEQEYAPFGSWMKVGRIFKQLPNKTSAGPDEIPAIVLKHLPPNIIRTYTIIFNNALNNCYLPIDWKKPKTIPIGKKDRDLSDPASYRPINLAPNISKVFEVLIKEALEEVCTRKKIIPDNQFGFRYGHSTEHAIGKLLSDVNGHLNNNEIVAACLIDIEKAFDTIWHNGLLYKLIKKGFPAQLINMVDNMINGQEFIVADGIRRSEKSFRIVEGLQQGRVCSPTLFNIYNDGINMADLNKNNKSYSIAFADDEIVYVAGKSIVEVKERLQELVEKRNKHHRTWNLKINPNKCETIIFRKPYDKLSKKTRTGLKDFHITISNSHNDETTRIPHKNLVRYLGVHVDHLLRMNKHIDTQLVKANKAYVANSNLFHNKHMPSRAKVICYQLLIRPILTYAPTAWWNISASTMEKLRRFERRCLRACLRLYRSQKTGFKHYISNRQLLNTADIPRIDNHILKLIRMFLSRTKSSNNELIRELPLCSKVYAEKCMKTGYTPIAAFPHIDEEGLIQDGQNVPILYHRRRNRANKAIPLDETTAPGQRNPRRYNTSIPEKDVNDFHRTADNLWWRAGNAQQMDELRRRRRTKETRS